jgi:NADH-quinone oxidoreductase subunit C
MRSGESIQTTLSVHFGEERVRPADYRKSGFHLRLELRKEQITELAQRLYEAGCWLEYLTAVDRQAYLELIYVYGQYREPYRIQAVVRIQKGEQAPSISRIFATADWHEREVYDFFGQIFTDHPNLKRILLPEDADYHPLLKDFKAPVRLNGEKGPLKAC